MTKILSHRGNFALTPDGNLSIGDCIFERWVIGLEYWNVYGCRNHSIDSQAIGAVFSKVEISNMEA